MKKFKENIVKTYGKVGQYWLNDLSSIVEKTSIKYELSNLRPFDNLSYNYVLHGKYHNKPIVLKICIDTCAREVSTLHAFSKCGGIKLLASDHHIILIEYAIPGTSLKSYFPKQDNKAIKITCQLIKNLQKAKIPDNSEIPHIKNELELLDKDLPIPSKLLQRARKLRDDLLKSSKKDVLLHGDLHHENIIKSSEYWLAIDPAGMIGDPDFETASFIINPAPELLRSENIKGVIRQRIKFFSQYLCIDEKRIVNWAFVKATLAWAWTIEDNLDSTYFRNLSEIIYDL